MAAVLRRGDDPALAGLGSHRDHPARRRHISHAALRDRPDLPPPGRRHHVRHTRGPSDGRVLVRGVRQSLAQPAVAGSDRPGDRVPAGRMVRPGRAPGTSRGALAHVRVPRLSCRGGGDQTRGMAHAGERRHASVGVDGASTATPGHPLLRGHSLAGGTSPYASDRRVDRDPRHPPVGQPARELLHGAPSARAGMGRGPVGTRTKCTDAAPGRSRQPARDGGESRSSCRSSWWRRC